MGKINFFAAWILILAGLVMGAGIGLFFHKETWLGGYDSWPRRMLRLAHIACFGTAFLNITFSLSMRYLQMNQALPLASILFIAGAFSMPLVCILSACWKPFRHLFFIPVLCLIGGTAEFIWKGLIQ